MFSDEDYNLDYMVSLYKEADKVCSENHKTLELEDDFQTQVMTLNSSINMSSVNRHISPNK